MKRGNFHNVTFAIIFKGQLTKGDVVLTINLSKHLEKGGYRFYDCHP